MASTFGSGVLLANRRLRCRALENMLICTVGVFVSAIEHVDEHAQGHRRVAGCYEPRTIRIACQLTQHDDRGYRCQQCNRHLQAAPPAMTAVDHPRHYGDTQEED